MQVALAAALSTLSSAANAVTVVLISHNQTSGGGAISTLITDGSHTQGQPASTAIFDWDGTTLSSTGLYSAVSSFGSLPAGPTIINDQVTDLNIDTSASSTAGSTAYTCNEGTFLASVGASGCGGHNFGANYVNDSTTTWGPGIAVSQTIGGDDVSTGGAPRDITAFNFGLDGMTGTGFDFGDQVVIGNGVVPGSTGGESMTFQVVTSAVDDLEDARPNEVKPLQVLANDALLDNITALTVTPVTDVANPMTVVGTAVVAGTIPGSQAGLSVTFQSNVGFIGNATFDYTVTDSAMKPGTMPPVPSDPVTATVTVTVTDGPVARDDGAPGTPFATVLAGDTASLDVLLNDAGLGDIPLTVVSPLNIMPTLGTAMVTGSPGDVNAIRIDYMARQTAGPDSFDYQVADNSGKLANATVFVEVVLQAVPVVPVAVDDAATTASGERVFVDVLQNDTNLDDSPLVVTITSDPANGVIDAITGCTEEGLFCRVPYVPDAGFTGVDTFQYMLTDSTPDDSNIATVTITVNEVPVAADDSAATSDSKAVTINVLANDAGLSFAPLTVTADPLASTVGTAAPQADNTIVYTPPAAGTASSDTFDYTVTDANGKSSTARVTVTIIAEQDSLPGKSSAVGPVGLGLLMLLSWMRRRRDC